MDNHDTKGRLRLYHVGCGLLCCLSLCASPALAQSSTSQVAPLPPPPGSLLCSDTMDMLPLGQNVFAAVETTQSEVIADRFNTGGLNVGESARIGGFLNSWSQTSYRIGDLDITDPSGSGAPLLFPELTFLGCVNTVTGSMSSDFGGRFYPADFNPSGLELTLFPTALNPQAALTPWHTTVSGSVSGGGLASPSPHGGAPPISRLSQYGHASVLTSGPLIRDRLSLVAGSSWQRATKFERQVTPATGSDLESGFAQLAYVPSQRFGSNTLVWVQRTSVPFAYRQLFHPDASTRDRTVHAQSTFERIARFYWKLSGGFTERSRHNDVQGISAITADRLIDGPIPAIAAAAGDQSAGRWTAAVRMHPTASRAHFPQIGASVDRSFLRTSDQFDGTIGELVDITPARRWFFTNPDLDSRRRATTIAAFATEHFVLSPALTVDAGLRFESVSGHADGAATDVAWLTVMPRAAVRWASGGKALVGGYRRFANRLNLDLLAYGDPNAETAIVTRFLTAPLAAAAIVDRVGPGTGGNPAFSRVDANLRRPYTDEYTVGVEAKRGALRYGLMGLARREANLIGVVDTGVPITGYSTIGIPDPGHDFNDTTDDQILTAYNRLPESYARNQYVLTNSGAQAATAYALTLWGNVSTAKLTSLFGATASMANGSAANRGYGPLENDQDGVGELLTDANATTFARGRLFSDRAFTIKWTTTYHFPKDIRVGVIARYQDGQPFARLVPVDNLNQGKELIRAYPNAGNRFTFTGTLDVRVQKGFTVGKQKIDGILDFYNLATRGNEVEEYTVTGPNFRTPTAIEPPRSIHIGVRLSL